MISIPTVLQGKKTYILMAIAVLTALGGYFTGTTDLPTTIMAVFGALGLSTVRAGSKTDAAAVIASRPGTDTTAVK